MRVNTRSILILRPNIAEIKKKKIITDTHTSMRIFALLHACAHCCYFLIIDFVEICRNSR